MSSFLKAKNQTHKRLEIAKEHGHQGVRSYSDRFNSPGSLYYNVNNNANNEVNEWTEEGQDFASPFKKVLTTEKEKEYNEAHFSKLYEDGIEHLIHREEITNAPLSKECTFSPKFETKGELESDEVITRHDDVMNQLADKGGRPLPRAYNEGRNTEFSDALAAVHDNAEEEDISEQITGVRGDAETGVEVF